MAQILNIQMINKTIQNITKVSLSLLLTASCATTQLDISCEDRYSRRSKIHENMYTSDKSFCELRHGLSTVQYENCVVEAAENLRIRSAGDTKRYELCVRDEQNELEPVKSPQWDADPGEIEKYLRNK
tara:strand:- start:117652 stop:118035 length:384 start_codon:yes stop_codon:yes gene_type:complete